jgi:DNA-binding NarL/FixJ family response regulator
MRLLRLLLRSQRHTLAAHEGGGAASGKVTVLVVEDDAIVREWVRLALGGSEFSVGGEAPTTAAALDLIGRRRADLLLVDHRLPDHLGTELVRQLRQSGNRTPAVIISARAEPGLNESAREAGAQGAVLKRGSVQELLDALRRVVRGEEAFDPSHPRRPPRRAALSPREREVVHLLMTGATNREISEQLGIGAETVKTILSRSYEKLGVKRRAEAVAVAHELGIS